MLWLSSFYLLARSRNTTNEGSPWLLCSRSKAIASADYARGLVSMEQLNRFDVGLALQSESDRVPKNDAHEFS